MKDLERARERMEAAQRTFALVALLPHENGSRVKWPHNGVIWTRVGEDEWVSDTGSQHPGAPSSHVVSCPTVTLRGEA